MEKILATLWGVSRKRMETLPQHSLAPPEMDTHSSGEADDTFRPTVSNLRNMSVLQLTAYIQALRQKQHIRHTLCRDAQNAADKKREDKLNDDIREGLFRSATHNARTLLYPKLQQQGVCMLRDPATRKVTTKPADIATLATEYTRNLLCNTPPEPPTGREWQNPEQWNDIRPSQRSRLRHAAGYGRRNAQTSTTFRTVRRQLESLS
jgi:hypothetical protein